VRVDLCEKHEKDFNSSQADLGLVWYSLSLSYIHNAKWNCLINHALSAAADLAVGICHISARRFGNAKNIARVSRAIGAPIHESRD
jgi:hypothetical protein